MSKPEPGPTDYTHLAIMALVALIGFVLLLVWVGL